MVALGRPAGGDLSLFLEGFGGWAADALVGRGVGGAGCPGLQGGRARRAAGFAAWAHRGQVRRTGEPYVSHCVATAKIVCRLLPGGGEGSAADRGRAATAVQAALLHDCVDDTEA